jgi:hypothetical protein
MPTALTTLASLLRLRSVRSALVAAVALGALAGNLPGVGALLEVPGYELGQLAALLAALWLGPWLGVAAWRLERARGDLPPLGAWIAASGAALAILAALLAGAAVRGALSPCRTFLAVGFFPVLALPSALLACALAVACAAATRGRRARVLYAAVVVALAALRAIEVYRGPGAFMLDPLLGYFPGPLYDEAVPLDARLLLARGEALGWALGVAGATAALAGRRRGPGAGLALLGLAVVSATLLPRWALQGGPDLRAGIAARLGRRVEGPRCTVHLPVEKPAAFAAELLAECEFHVADVAARLGVAAPPHVTVFLYRSAEEKRRATGAAQTDFTKPWLAEIHVNDAPLPHPVLRHEIVHAVASALAPGPLHLPARLRLFPAMGLVEGLAVALESPRSGFTVDEWSRAARDLGYLPDPARLLGPGGFWAEAPARAYTAAGSFLAWLLARDGPGPVAAAYRGGDLDAALSGQLAARVAAWTRDLDAVPVSSELAAAAQRWFARGSLFERRCARELAASLRDAGLDAAQGRIRQACTRYDRAAALGAAAEASKAKGDVLATAGELAAAEAAYRAAEAVTPPAERARLAALRTAEGDLAWRRGDVAAAQAAWAEAQAAPPERVEARLLALRRLAAADPALSGAVLGYLLGLSDPAVALAQVAQVDRPVSTYLLGRALVIRGERAAAAPLLARAAAAPLPEVLALEARLSLVEASCAAAAEPLPRGLGGPADRLRLEEARRRCAFEQGQTATRSP